MNSIGNECNELKAKYDECFQVWFSQKFLKGDTDDDMCQPIFGVYKECVRVSFYIFILQVSYVIFILIRKLCKRKILT